MVKRSDGALRPSTCLPSPYHSAMLEHRLRQQFYDASDALVQWADGLTPRLAAASEMLVQALTSGGRILVAGSAWAHADALEAAAVLVGQLDRQRPGLAALVLGADAVTLAGMASPAGRSWPDALLRQLQALGQPGDVLMLFDGLGHPLGPDVGTAATGWADLVRAAHDKDMTVVQWSTVAPSASVLTAPAPLLDTDVWIPVPVERPALQRLAYRWGWLCVADSIDAQLLGDSA